MSRTVIDRRDIMFPNCPSRRHALGMSLLVAKVELFFSRTFGLILANIVNTPCELLCKKGSAIAMVDHFAPG